MDYNKLIKALLCDGYGIGQDSDGCSNKKCKYRDTDGACNIVSMCGDAAAAITDLLDSAEAAENRLQEAEAQKNYCRKKCDVSDKNYQIEMERRKAAEARAEKAEKERDKAVSDLTFAVNQYRLFTTDIDLCGLCKFDLPPAGENGQTYECPGFYKDNCFEWRGMKEE